MEDFKTEDGYTVALRIDVTDLKRAEIALERQRLEYYSLVQNIPDVISRVAPDLTYTFVTTAMRSSAGMAADALIGRQLLDFVPEEDRANLAALLKNLSIDEPLSTREQHRKLPDGSDLWLFWSNIALYERGELIEYVTVGRDITELKLQQQRIARRAPNWSARTRLSTISPVRCRTT